MTGTHQLYLPTEIQKMLEGAGRVPDLIDAGFRGEIICTHATKALLIPMLHDTMSFSDRSGKEVPYPDLDPAI